jgi:hypothetical protein
VNVRRITSQPESGLQGERTALAWSRTVLAVAATAGLIARTADAGVERAAIGLAAVGTVLVALVAASRRPRVLGESVPTASGAVIGGLLAGITTLLAAGVIVIL